MQETKGYFHNGTLENRSLFKIWVHPQLTSSTSKCKLHGTLIPNFKVQEFSLEFSCRQFGLTI
jgi:hypothetical protein